MGEQNYSVLFLGKAHDWHTTRAVEFCQRNFENVQVFLGTWGDPLPVGIAESQCDCIISYLSRWIIPAAVLDKAALAINFHPGSPEYPGYGCNNFAIYEGAAEFGATCHHMAAQIDVGPIVAVSRFPVLPTDTGGTLLLRTYDRQLVLFYDVIERIIRGVALPAARDRWTRKPFTRGQFEALGRITPEMSDEEAMRRRKAVDVSALQQAG